MKGEFIFKIAVAAAAFLAWNSIEAASGAGDVAGRDIQSISREDDDDKSRDRKNADSDDDSDKSGGRNDAARDDNNDRSRARREANPRAGRQFAHVEETRRLIGMNVQNARGRDIGKLTDMVVDLEAGRVVYAVVNLAGRGGAKAVAPQGFSLAANDQTLRFTGDENRLKSAPEFSPRADASNARFAMEVYTHFGREHDWFDASRNFANAHKASELTRMKVQNVQDQNVGQMQNLMVDLPKARVLYVILSAAPIVGRGEHVFPLPPNAFTHGRDGKTLVSDVDKAKLEGAPRFSRTNLRELASPAKAAEIYRYYGKQPYWNAGELSPTGRERGR